jgi:hypothetical protein
MSNYFDITYSIYYKSFYMNYVYCQQLAYIYNKKYQDP